MTESPLIKSYIGIDPGAKGFISYNHERFLPLADSTPTQIVGFLKVCQSDARGNIHACIEDVHAIYSDTPKTAFALGRSYGFLVGVLTSLAIPYTAVSPARWQNDIFCPSDRRTKTSPDSGRVVVDTKSTSIAACSRLFPEVDLRRTERCRNLDHNKSDAILLGEYARRHSF